MLEINKTLNITSYNSEKYTDIDANEINVHLSKPYVTLFSNSINNKYIINYDLNVKINDLIKVNICFKNESNVNIKTLKLKFLYDSNFEFITGSLINSITKECYFSNTIKDNSIELCNLPPNEILNISFFIKAIFKNLDYINQDDTVLLLLPNFSSKSLTLKDLSKRIIISLNQAIIKINSDPNRGILTIENIGNNSVNNVFLKYSLPSNLKFDVSSFKALLNNEPYPIYTKKFENDILFSIPSIPKYTNEISSKIIIKFDSIDLNSLNSCKITIK